MATPSSFTDSRTDTAANATFRMLSASGWFDSVEKHIYLDTNAYSTMTR